MLGRMPFSGLPAVRVAVSALADHLTRAPPVVRSVMAEGSPDQLTTEELWASTMGFVETAFPRHDSEVWVYAMPRAGGGQPRRASPITRSSSRR